MQGISLLGNLKYRSGFLHFDYVNAHAPKAGSVRRAVIGTYDSFNLVVAGVKGNLAEGIDLIYDTLMVPALDEIASEYGLIAEAVRYPSDFSWVSFRLRPTARWHDGKLISSEDVIFSLKAFKKLRPRFAAFYRHVVKAQKVNAHEVIFWFDRPGIAGCRKSLGSSRSCADTGGREWTNLDSAVISRKQRWNHHWAPARIGLRRSRGSPSFMNLSLIIGQKISR